MLGPVSLFDRWIGHPRARWPGLVLCLGLLSLPIVLTLAEGGQPSLRDAGMRGLLIAPAVITYILLVSPLLSRTSDDVLLGLRPLLGIDEADFRALLVRQDRGRPSQERRVLVAGGLLGALQVVLSNGGLPDSWQEAYWLLTTAALYALLGWVILGSFAGTRLIAAIHREIPRVDPLDPSPFDAVGRQSLLAALVFVGGISLSLVLVANQPEALRRPEFWLIYLSLAAITLTIFFMNMRPSHRLLSEARGRELQGVARQVNESLRRLRGLIEAGQPTGDLPAEIGALMAYERRLELVRTWPYDTAMLRTLGISVFVPLAAVVVRSLLERLYG